MQTIFSLGKCAQRVCTQLWVHRYQVKKNDVQYANPYLIICVFYHVYFDFGFNIKCFEVQSFNGIHSI